MKIWEKFSSFSKLFNLYSAFLFVWQILRGKFSIFSNENYDIFLINIYRFCSVILVAVCDAPGNWYIKKIEALSERVSFAV